MASCPRGGVVRRGSDQFRTEPAADFDEPHARHSDAAPAPVVAAASEQEEDDQDDQQDFQHGSALARRLGERNLTAQIKSILVTVETFVGEKWLGSFPAQNAPLLALLP